MKLQELTPGIEIFRGDFKSKATGKNCILYETRTNYTICGHGYYRQKFAINIATHTHF